MMALPAKRLEPVQTTDLSRCDDSHLPDFPQPDEVAPMCIQTVLDSVEALPDRLPDCFRLEIGYSASSREITESKSNCFKEGRGVRFDIIHRTVVLVDKRSPLLVRQRHWNSNRIPSLVER